MEIALEISPAIRTDILDKGDHYQLQAELPGFNKEDIKINLEGDCLTIQAEHKEETEEKKKEYVRKERHYGSLPEALISPASTPIRSLPTTRTAF